jgi:succinate dehydrogenase / fumarate reductase cytochrome b subunit
MAREPSPLLESFRKTFDGFTSYRFRTGQLSFILHRLTGLGTLLFLSVHILDTATVYFAPQLYEHAIAIYRSTPMMLGEIVLVFCVIYHGVNGARIAIFDLFSPRWWSAGPQEKTALTTLAVAVLLWLPAAFMMGRSLVLHNF